MSTFISGSPPRRNTQYRAKNNRYLYQNKKKTRKWINTFFFIQCHCLFSLFLLVFLCVSFNFVISGSSAFTASWVFTIFSEKGNRTSFTTTVTKITAIPTSMKGTTSSKKISPLYIGLKNTVLKTSPIIFVLYSDQHLNSRPLLYKALPN